LKAILGNKVAPGLLDRYLARNGYDAQQTDRRVNPDRPANLFEPVAGDHGSHGIFDDRARKTSVQFWETRHRTWATFAALGTITVVAAWAVRRNSH
jgi:hypothetical protein